MGLGRASTDTRGLRRVVVAALLFAGCGASTPAGAGGQGGMGGSARGGDSGGGSVGTTGTGGASGAGGGGAGPVGPACPMGTAGGGSTTAVGGAAGTNGAAGTTGPPFSLLTYPVTQPGPGNSGIDHMALAPNGDMIVAGYFQGVFDLDPSAGTDGHASCGGTDVFVSRLGPDGVPRWTKVLAGAGDKMITGLAVDDEGAVVVVGWFSGRADLDPGPAEDVWVTTPSAQGFPVGQGFAMKLSPAGDRRWLWSPGAGSICMAVAWARGTVLVAGGFTGPTDFDPGAAADMRPSLGGDAFVIALDGDGQLARPAWTFGGPDYDTVHAVAIGPDGSWYVAGRFSDGTDFDPGSGVVTLPLDLTQTTLGGFALALGAGGALRWLKPYPYAANAPGLTLDGDGRVILWGQSRSAAGVLGLDQTFVTRLDRAGDAEWTRTWSPANAVSLAVAAADGSLALAGNFLDQVVIEGHTFFNDGTNFSTLLVGLSPLGETRSIQVFGDTPSPGGIGSVARFARTADLLPLPDRKLLLAGGVGGEVALPPAGVATIPVGLAGFVARLPAP